MDWITACGILGISPDASEKQIKEQRNYWLNVLHPDKTAGLSERIKERATKDFIEKKTAWEYLLQPGNRPTGGSTDQAQTKTHRDNSTGTYAATKPKPVVTPSNIVFNDMEPGQSKKASFVVDNTGGPFDILKVSNPKSWLKIIDKHYSSIAKGLPLKVEIEATGLDWGVKSSENIYVELDDVKTTLTAEVHMKPKPTSDSTDHVESTKVPRWAIGILIILALAVGRFVTSTVNSGCANSSATTSSVASISAQEHVTKGDSYIWEQKQYDQAIVEYTKAIELDPKLLDAHFGLAWAYDSKKEYDKAISECNKALEINPQYAPAFYIRGLVYGGQGEYDKSIVEFNRAIELKPQYYIAYFARGLVYKYNGEYDKSLADFTKTIEESPDNAEAYHERGLVYEAKGENDKAEADFSMAKELGYK